MVNPVYDALAGPDLIMITLFKEATRTWEQMDDIRQAKIQDLFKDASRLDQLPGLIHPSKIDSDTIWKFAFKSSLAAQSKLFDDPDEEPERALQLRNVEGIRHADLTTILVKCQKKPVGIFLSALGRNADGSRDLEDDEYYEDDEDDDGDQAAL